MAITRWDPFGEMLSMQREIDRLFSRLGTAETGGSAPSMVWMPRIDVKSTGDDMVVYAELPGMSRDDIDIEVTDDVLTVKGTRTAQETSEGEGWIIRERSHGTFERRITLPDGIDPETITAEYTNGVLEVHVPKAVAALKPRTHRVALT